MRKDELPTPNGEESELPKEKSEGELIREWENLISQNNDVIENDTDGIFAAFMISVRNGWETLAPSQKREIIGHTAKLMRALRDYHDGYTTLKSAADIRHSYFQDTQKYQTAIERADRQERILHNAFLDALNILSRRMKEFGLDNGWRGTSIIYDTDTEAMREKVKLWMFRIFNKER